MKKFLLSMMLCAVMVFGSLSAMADTLDDIQKRGKLLIGLDPGYMPFEMKNQRGEIIGFDVDLAKRMAKAMGVKLEIVPTAFDGIIPALLTGKFDILATGMTLTQERNMSINFAHPYIEVGQSAIINNKIASVVKSYKDLNDPKYTIAVRLGTTGEQAAKRLIPDAKHLSFETEQECVLEVVNGRADAFVYDMPYNVVAVAQRGSGKITHLDKAFTFEPLSWGIRKNDPNLLNWLNNFIYQIKRDGTYDKIYKKWFQDDSWIKEIQ